MKVPRHTTRRHFLTALGASTHAVLSPACEFGRRLPQQTPLFLSAHSARYKESPRAVALEWFEQAEFGLSFRYGVYRQLAANEWVQLDEGIPAAEYEQLQETFDPSGFHAGELTDLALEAGAAYIRFPARLADGFCLFRTNETPFTSLSSPSRRDLVDEMCDACAGKGLELFLEYSYALDWRHPYFYPRDSVQLDWPYAGLDENLTPAKSFQTNEDFLHYIKYAHAQLKEILYRYVPLAGIALTPVIGYYARPDLFPLATTYQIIREAQPHALISFELGANGDEDFTSTAGKANFSSQGGRLAQMAWEKNRSKPAEQRLPLSAVADLAAMAAARAFHENDSGPLLLEVQLSPNGSYIAPGT